jgi:hypothetical protein
MKRMMNMKTRRQNEVLVEEVILSVWQHRSRRFSVEVSNVPKCDRAFLSSVGGVVAAWFNRRNRRNDNDA